jgi:hypothetical protein
LATNSTAITTAKKRWERAEFWLEAASVIGGLMVGVGLWIEGESTFGQRLVTGGVAMEVICAWWVLIASRKLQNILETEFAKVRLETANANQRAAEAEKHAAEAQLELERFRAPRIIQNRDEVVSELKAVLDPMSANAIRVEIFTVDNDDEVIRLRDQFIDLLQQAGWRVQMNLNRRISGDMPTNGVTVEIHVGSTVRSFFDRNGNVNTYNLGEKALAVVSAFRNGGLQITGPMHSSKMATDAQIEIVIGNKPRD